MCAITGIINLDGPVRAGDTRVVEAMLARMRHRGPDHSGRAVAGSRAVLGSNRLAITDHSNRDADMPISSADGRILVVFNGEIYNHRQLRAELGAYPFRTASDTEVLVAAYLRWGKAMLNRLEGMFAFCLYDAELERFLLATDPSGQKPLYYIADGDSLVFASEMEPLIFDAGRRLTWHRRGIAEIVATRFCIGEDTHISEIKRLVAGSSIEVGGRLETSRYHCLPIGDQSRTDLDEVAGALRDAVESACLSTFDLEVPYGILVSGGIDSAAVLSLAAGAGLDLRTYSVGFVPFEGPSIQPAIWNEFEFSRQLTQLHATRHSELVLEREAYFQYLDRWCATAGEPLGSQEAPCLMRLFEAISGECKVVFCGSGPDEVFDGYGNGRALLDAGVGPEQCCRAYYDSFRWTGEVDLERLLPGSDVGDRVTSKLEQLVAPYRETVRDTAQLVQLINYHGRCATYEYRQMDKISMAHSIEVRTPLADSRVARAAFDFDAALKHKNGEEKWIWKQAMAPYVPRSIYRRKKAAFPIPSGLWYTPEFVERVEPILASGSALSRCGALDMQYLRSLWDGGSPGHRNIFYRLLVLDRVMSSQAAFVI